MNFNNSYKPGTPEYGMMKRLNELKDKLTNEWPSIICVIFSILSILILGIFNHKQMKNELERRLHI